MTYTTVPPSAADQLLFLSRVQRLLDSGRFTATYKFALLLSLAELAVERGDDSGCTLLVPMDVISERFLSIYWSQAAPYQSLGAATVLRQNTGRQAAIITKIAETQRAIDVSLGAVKSRPEWNALVRTARQLVVTMPLLRLQSIGTDEGARQADCFLYENIEPVDDLELYPGVAFCLRRFFPVLQGMVRAKWIGWVQAQNCQALGAVQDLEGFMFGIDRRKVRAIIEPLLELQRGKCFYRPLISLDPTTVHVDHFIPWAKYPCDTVANLVLASPSANNNKKDHLPATVHLDRWCERNDGQRALLAYAAKEAGLEAGEGSIKQVAAWAYGSQEAINGLVWHATTGPVHLDPRWRQILGV